jgi:hypothetical protein
LPVPDQSFLLSTVFLYPLQIHLPSQSQARQNVKSSASLDGGDNDRVSVISWGDEIRPASAQANPIRCRSYDF